MCIYIYIYTRVCVSVCVYIYIYIHTYVYIIHIYIYLYTSIHMHTHIGSCTCVHTHIHWSPGGSPKTSLPRNVWHNTSPFPQIPSWRGGERLTTGRQWKQRFQRKPDKGLCVLPIVAPRRGGMTPERAWCVAVSGCAAQNDAAAAAQLHARAWGIVLSV